MKNGINLDRTEWVYDNYKEPLKQVGKGVGFQGVVIRSKDGEYVQSNIDGLFYKSINNMHVKQGGFNSILKYRKFYGIGSDTYLMGKSLQIKKREAAEKKYLNTPAKVILERRKKGLKRIKELRMNEKRKGTHIALEHRNKRGTCPDQLLDKIKKIAKKIGRSPSTDDFRNEYDTKFLGTIYFHFGSWVNAVKLAGFKPRKEFVKENMKDYKEKRKIELIEKLKIFYEMNKRSPLSQDFGKGVLPGRHLYGFYFRTLNTARKEAGIPLVIHGFYNKRYQIDTLLENAEY